MKKNIWQVIPATGYITILLALFYNLILTVPLVVSVLLLLLLLLELVMIFGLVSRKMWAYRINILLLCLSVYGLFTSTVSFESILSLAGELLVVPFYGEFIQNKKK